MSTFLGWICLFSIASSIRAYDDLYILIDEISVYNCRGVKNEISIDEEDVQVVNEKGNKAYYIHAPGNYSLHFKRINVQKDFGHLAGEIGITLQVPIIEGPAGIRFDLPYTVVPETGLLSQQCDENSGIIERNGRQYCRYCDLCSVKDKVEGELTAGTHQFLSPQEPQDNQGATCGYIGAKEYEIKRAISLPSRSKLESLIKSKVHAVDDEIRKRLNKGRGRFQVFLNLITADKPAISKQRWFAGSKECRCCNSTDPSCGNVSPYYCNIEDCKSGWALQCLHNTARIAACFSVEFNYRMTTSYADVLQFLRENNYPNQEVPSQQVVEQRPRQEEAETIAVASPVQPAAPVASSSNLSGSLSDRCVAQISPRLVHLKRYCTVFWNAKLCCAHCNNVCTD